LRYLLSQWFPYTPRNWDRHPIDTCEIEAREITGGHHSNDVVGGDVIGKAHS